MYWKIGEFSRFTRVSVKMLRHYDELGLLRPAAVDPSSGYRYYLAEQVVRLNRLLALRDLGFSLQEVAGLLDRPWTAEGTEGLLLRRRAEILARLDEEQARLRRVDERLRALAEEQLRGYDVVLRAVPAQLVAAVRARVAPDGEGVAGLFDEVETFAAGRGARAATSPLLLLHGAPDAAGEQDVEAAVPLTRAVPAAGRVAVRELPPLPQAACVVYRGEYDQTDAALRALHEWAGANGLRPDGPPREVYLRFGADGGAAYQLQPAFLSDDARAFVTEVQLPVAALLTP